jgi:hypothetical protein
MLVPSFSSKGFPDVGHIIDVTEPYIESQVPISAYDIYYKYISNPMHFPSLLFIDSGGYEASIDMEMSSTFDAISTEYVHEHWDEKLHESAITSWTAVPPTVYISYDHPSHRLPIEDQIKIAIRLGKPERQIAREILLKPTTQTQNYLRIPEILAHTEDLYPFCAIGMTEKEIGKSLLERMTNIGKLRQALTAAKLEIPIHIFGSLDTMSTLLYFVMGADIFDGLTWLRYGYHEGMTLYRHEFATLKYPATTHNQQINEMCCQSNYLYLREMELRMGRFLSLGEFSSFEWNCDKIERLYQ